MKKSAFTKNIFIIGDFNLDYNQVFNDSYGLKHSSTDFEKELGALDLIQLVKFPTWSRLVENQCLDHIYHVLDKTDNSMTKIRIIHILYHRNKI